MEAEVQRGILDFRCSLLGFPRLTHFQGYNTKIDGLSINKLLFLIVSLLCLMAIRREGGKEAEGKKYVHFALAVIDGTLHLTQEGAG